VQRRRPSAKAARQGIEIPDGVETCSLEIKGEVVRLTGLNKIFWPELKLQKRDLLRYYLQISQTLIPHLKNRALVMKRYPDGIAGEFFFMKRVPPGHPEWIQVCTIPHRSGNVIDFPVVQDLPSLLWVVNLACIDLNQWYATCDDVNRPDYIHFDLDPVPPAGFDRVCEAALHLNERLKASKIRSYPKTSGSRGIHVYIPLQRGPLQKQVWTRAKALAREMAAKYPALLTAEYRVANRPAGHVLIDYNQNAWGRTLASVYSLRPTPLATVSTPVTWDEVAAGITIDQFRISNVPSRIAKLGDLFRPLLQQRGRHSLEEL